MKYRDHDRYEKFSRKERMRKSKESRESIEDMDLNEKEWAIWLQKGYFAARVVEVHKKYVFVSPEPTLRDVETEDVWIATVARRYLQAKREERNVLAVGDRVLCRKDSFELGEISRDLPQCLVEYRSPRTTKLSRKDPMYPAMEHVLAVNMEQIVVVASYFYPALKWGLIDRYLIIAAEQGIDCTIILNKRDLLSSLAKDKHHHDIYECTDYYRNVLGYKVLSVQANEPTRADLKAVKEVFAGKISSLSGHSGVGKSSLVNLLKPEIVQDVETEDILTKGRHTTSYASFIKLGKNAGYVIDTPGIRSFALIESSPVYIMQGFKDLADFSQECRYRECTHHKEPECGVKSAVEAGKIPLWRYNSYLGLILGTTGREGRMREQAKRREVFEEEDENDED